MLVLTRKKDEQLQIGEQITVTVLKVKGSSVQIGIEAPRSVKVLRSELAGVEPEKPKAEPGDAEQAGKAFKARACRKPGRPLSAAVRGVSDRPPIAKTSPDLALLQPV